MNLIYPCEITEEDDGFLIQFIDLPEAFTEGDTLEEALVNAEDVLTGILEIKMQLGQEIALPSKIKRGQHGIAPSVAAQSALLLRVHRGDKTISELARDLETGFAAVKRLEDPLHTPSLRQLERVARALGRKLVLSFD